MMSLHKLTAGDGYTYLIRQTAAADATERGRGSLGEYYSAKGEAPGRWWGAGLAGLGVTGQVTEQQMMNLFGEGIHPNAQQVRRELLADGRSYLVAEKAAKLGRQFAVYTATEDATLWRTRLARAYAAFNEAAGLPGDWCVPAADREAIRTRIGRELFTEKYARPPADERELHGFIARVSRQHGAVAGYDLTFSPPKSISALWALAPLEVSRAIEDAHHAAVEKTLRWLETEAAFTRTGAQGVAQVNVRGLLVTLFTHRDSRAGDPDLHTHAAVSNKVQTLDGRWLALDGRVWHKVAVAASEMYNTEIEAELLQRVTLDFETRDMGRGKHPVREIAGIDARLLDHWSSRGKAVTARRAQLAADFQSKHGRPPTVVESIHLAQQATLETRQRKHEPRSLAEQRAAWRTAAQDLLGRARLQTMLQGVGLRRSPTTKPFEPTAITADLVDPLAEHVLARVEDARARWQHNHLLADAQRLVGHRTDVPLPSHLAAALARIAPSQRAGLARQVAARALAPDLSVAIAKDGIEVDAPVPAPLRRLDGASVYTTHGAQLYTSTRILAAEQRILAAAGQRDGRRTSEADVQLAMLEWSANNEGRVLNHGQAGVVREMATSGARVQLALAPAGTGKTTMMGVLAAAWTGAGGTVIGLAPQAAAAEELSMALGGAPADTLAKLVYELRNPSDWTPDWVRDVDERTLLILDEAGLASTPQLDEAIDYVLARGGSVRLVGDDQQLAATAAGGILRDIAAAHGALTLTEVVRFTDRTEGHASLALRTGDPSAIGYYLDHDRVHAGDVDTVVEQVYTAWSADRAAGRNALMLAPTLDVVAQLNARARADRLAAAGVDTGREVVAGGRDTVSAGDVVITKLNDRRLSLGGTDFVKNGQRWHVDQVHPDGSLAVTHLQRRKQIRLPADYVADHVRLGYASTLRGCQGITVGRPRGLAGVCHAIITPDLERADLYMALTRGTDGNHAYVVVTGAGEEHSIVRPEAISPATAAEILIAILARDSQVRSATTELREAADPIARLGAAAAAYRDAIATGAAHLLGDEQLERFTAAAERIVPGVTDAPAWETLRAHLALLTLAGRDAPALLQAAADQREVRTARDVAAVLDWRLDRSGNHSQGTGPLPWLPAVPAVLASEPTWGAFLHAVAHRVSQLTNRVQTEAATWAPDTAPMWAQPCLEHPELVAELAVWRAATGTPISDPRPAGGPQQAIALQRHRDDLVRRALAASGAREEAAERWAPVVAAIDDRITADDYWPVVAARLNTADAAGLPVAALIRDAATAGPLPDEQPSAALWWRLARHLSPAGDVPAGSNRARPPWLDQLDPALRDTLTDRVTSDRLWPSIVARMDTATRDGHDPTRLARDAAAMLAAHTGSLSPAELAPSLLWTISTLADPEPVDPDFEVPHPDELPPADFDDVRTPHHDETSGYGPTSIEAPTADLDDIDAVDAMAAAAGTTVDEPPYDPDYDPAPPDPIDAPTESMPEPRRRGPVQIDVDTPDTDALFALQLRGPASPARARLLELNEQALEFFQAHYRDAWAADYVTERLGVDLAGDERFQPGYAPAGWTALTDYLRGRGATDSEIVAAGLGSYSRTGRVIDRFRDRLVAPVYHDGELRGFIGRRNPARGDEDRAGPKYLNTAETDLYSKGEQLYGYYQHHAALTPGLARPVIVEGLLDAWVVTLAGEQLDVPAVGLATLGTALTDRHATQLRAVAGPRRPTPIVAFDPDPAGRRATEAAFWKLAERGITADQLRLADGIDPAKLYQDNGPGALAAALGDRVVPLARVLIDGRIAAFAHRLHEAEARVFAARRAAEIIASLPPEQWTEWASYVAEITSTSMPVMQLEIVTASQTLNPLSVPPAAPPPAPARHRPAYASTHHATDLAQRAAQLTRDPHDTPSSTHHHRDPHVPDHDRGRKR